MAGGMTISEDADNHPQGDHVGLEVPHGEVVDDQGSESVHGVVPGAEGVENLCHHTHGFEEHLQTKSMFTESLEAENESER